MTEIKTGLETSERELNEYDLAPIEHIIIGSSIEFAGNKSFNAGELNKQIQEANLDPKILIPRSLDKGFDPNKARDVSVSRTGKKLKGTLACFDNSQIDLDNEGIRPALELAPLDEKTGQVKPIWVIKLEEIETGEEVDKPEFLDRLKIREGYGNAFILSEEEGQLYLKFRPSLQHAA